MISEYKKLYFTSRQTDCIKFIALILMFFHHFFHKEWFVLDNTYLSMLKISSVELESFLGDTGKLCVAIFSFLSGYGLYFSYKKKCTIRHLIKKIISHLMQYWFVLMVVFVPLYLHLGFKINVDIFIKMLLGLSEELNLFSWYVCFHVIVLVSLFLLQYFKILKTKAKYFLIIFALFPFLRSTNIFLNNILKYLPVGVLGYVFAEKNIVELILHYMENRLITQKRIVLGFIMGGGTLCIRYIITRLTHWKIWCQFDGVFAFLFILGCLLIINNLHINNKISKSLGKASVYMWYLHAIFFGVYAVHTQRFAYYPRFSILIILWNILILYIISDLLQKLYDRLINFLA